MKNNISPFYWFNGFLYFRPHWPIAIIYFETITNSYTTAMAVFSIIFISQALLEIPTGLLSDTIGRRKTLIFGALFSFLSLLAYAIGLNFWFLALGGILEGLSRSFFSGTKNALLYETLKEEKQVDAYDTVLGKTNSISQLALGISALLCAILALHSLALVLWVSVIPQFLGFLVSFLFQDAKHIDRRDDHIVVMLKSAFKQFKENQRLRLISTAEVIDFGVGEAMFYFQAAFFKMVIPEWLIGIVRGLNHLCSAISFWFAGKTIKAFGYHKTLIGGNALLTFVEFFAVIFPTALSPFLMALSSLAFGANETARSSLMQKDFTDNQRATMDSMISLAGSLLFAVASAFLGLIADLYSPIHAILIGLSSNIVVIALYVRNAKIR